MPFTPKANEWVRVTTSPTRVYVFGRCPVAQEGHADSKVGLCRTFSWPCCEYFPLCFPFTHIADWFTDRSHILRCLQMLDVTVITPLHVYTNYSFIKIKIKQPVKPISTRELNLAPIVPSLTVSCTVQAAMHSQMFDIGPKGRTCSLFNFYQQYNPLWKAFLGWIRKAGIQRDEWREGGGNNHKGLAVCVD